MPVNTAITLLPATPTRLQSAASDGDAASSFQDTLQRVSSPQAETASGSDDTPARDRSSAAKADDNSKARSADGAKAAQRAKGKRAKFDEETHETGAAQTGRAKGRVEAAKDATDDSDEKPSANLKSKQAATAVAAKADDRSTAVAQSSVTQPARQTGPFDTEADEPAPDAARHTTDESGKHATVKKISSEADDGDADGDRAEATNTEAAEGESESGVTESTAPADAEIGVATGAPAKTGRKGMMQAEDAEHAENSTPAAAVSAAVASTAALAAAVDPDQVENASTAAPQAPTAIDPASAAVTAIGPTPTATALRTAAVAAADPAAKALATPEAQFADTNHAKIVSSVHGQLLPGGGTMQIRLDPPELGALSVSVQMRNGAMTATFETSSPEATQLLSHSLGDLRTVLESSGVTVDKIHVQQSAKPDGQSGGGDGSSKDRSEQNPQAKQEQQRRELLQRMWKKLSGGDPLDLTA